VNEVNIKPLRAWDRGRNTVAYVYKDDAGKTQIGEVNYLWFFYIYKKDFNKHKPMFERMATQNIIRKWSHGEKYTKIFVDRSHASDLLNQDNEFVWEYQDRTLNYILKALNEHGIKHFEADLKVFQRWIVSNNINYETKYRILFLDIETDDEKAKGQPVPGEFRILSCAFVDGDTGKKAWLCATDKTDEAEEVLIRNILKVINSYDVMVAWNGQYFDFPYIRSRAMRYGIRIVDWRKKFLQDHLRIWDKLGPKGQSLSLDYVSKSILKRGKIAHGKKIFQLFDSDKNTLREYNLEDVQLMFDIEKKTGFLAAAREVNAIGRCPCDDIFITRKIDMMLLEQAYKDDTYHFKSKEWKEEQTNEKYTGAYVVEPLAGLYKNVRVFDYAALYPSVIQTYNISPDTLIGEDNELEVSKEQIIIAPNNQRYRKDFIGLIPKVIRRMAERRKHFKDLMKTVDPGSSEYKTYDKLQYVFKYFGLSFYGAMGEQNSRFFDIRIAESVTIGGQHTLKNTIEFIENRGLKAIYGDTDSIFTYIDDDADIPALLSAIEKNNESITKKANCDSSCLEMAYDKGFSKFVITGKKRYAGNATWLEKPVNNVLYVAGMEFKRTDVCMFVKRKQEEFLKLILGDKDVSIDEIRDFIDGMKRYIFSKEVVLDDIMLGQKLTKQVSDYATETMHLKVVEEMQRDNKEVWVGDKIHYFIKDVDSKTGKPVPCPSYKFEGKFAAIYYWNNKIWPAFERIVEVAYPNVKWERYQMKVNMKKISGMGRMDLW
jgi:DNA polymerase elongation subunit (family B)